MGDMYNRGGGAQSPTSVTTTIVTTDDLEVDSGTLSIDADNNRVGIGTTAPGVRLEVQDTTTSSANTGGALRLSANDGAPMGDSHRLGVIEFTGAEDASNTQVVGARIEALTDAAWTNAENGCALYFYTTDGNASQTNVLKIDSNQKATFSGEVEAASLDISGDADIDGTLEADAITVNGKTLTEKIADTVGDMVASNTETGIAVTYEDADNTLDFAVSAAQTGITSVVNASLEIGRDADNRIKFGTDNQIIFEVDGGDNVIFKTSGEIEATSLDISGDVDVDGTLEADAITVNGSALAASATTDTTNASNISSGTVNAARMAAAQTAITSVLNTSLVVGRDADNQLKFGTDNEITFRVSGNDGVVMKASGELEATSLDISGDADIDGTLEADAITVDGTALNEYIADTVGAMVSSNTETGITVSYDDADNTLDFVLAAVGTNAISDDAVTLDKMAGLARGKIIVGDSSGNPVALALGNDTQVLTSDGTDVVWADASGGSVSNDDANLILAVQSFS